MKRSQKTSEEPNQVMNGVRTAIVRDNEDPEGLGRVKVSYPWRDADDESHWARLTTEMTGSGYGMFFLPEVEDEVLVGFENGDIHNPVVLGSLYSGNRKPPHDNSSGDNDKRAITTRSGHKLEFDDNDSEAMFTIETNGGHKFVMKDKSGSEVVKLEDSEGNMIEMDSPGGTISITANTEISLEAPTISLSAKSEIKGESKGKLELKGAQSKLIGDAQLDLESALMGIAADGPLTIEGAIIQLN